jgi:LacI family transcriptional regulator
MEIARSSGAGVSLAFSGRRGVTHYHRLASIDKSERRAPFPLASCPESPPCATSRCDAEERLRESVQTGVTLRDVARLAGVHPGTASRALNDATRILVKAETVERVTAAANALGYKPNYLARSFKTRRTLSIGVIIPDINNPLFPPMLRGVEDRLADAGYVALLANTENDGQRERRIFDELLGRQVDGLVLATARRDDPRLVELGKEGVPMVLVNRVVDDHAFSSVSVDDGAGVRLVVDHLGRLGHRRIGHVAGPQSYSTGFGRYRGFVTSMTSNGLTVDSRLVSFASSFSIAEGLRCARELLSRTSPPTAIVAGNDMLALGCFTVLEELGLRCPEDVSIVGFNDMPFIDRLRTPLTSVRIPHYEIGTHAAELMLERIERPDSPLKVLLLAPELVVRASTAPMRAPATGGTSKKGARTSRSG